MTMKYTRDDVKTLKLTRFLLNTHQDVLNFFTIIKHNVVPSLWKYDHVNNETVRNIIFLNLYSLGYHLPITPISATFGQSLSFSLHFLALPSLISKPGVPLSTNVATHHILKPTTLYKVCKIFPYLT
ncbi:hypothetical protein PHAVU_007G245900 [Phaseolus vulgaris]|uniref:Uncharacterized protein n=1 Tax=Phaseolus vulgaris TaxID=3885 RepID=V7BKE4_PHAVU|nr:hypothetical protein PHAVU_007G245900g [Phaseolus vulgaris]ESW17520.1 hypothetical protein PHAVU_007G245900g [Phaseolus vulgaris]